MAEFKSNVPVIQADPNVTVDVTAASPLPDGTGDFQVGGEHGAPLGKLATPAGVQKA